MLLSTRLLLPALLVTSSAMALAAAPAEQTAMTNQDTRFSSDQRQPCNHYDPLRRPHFGDTHVHTAWSFDANSQGTRNRPADAYRFAKGEPLGIQPYDENDQPLRTIQLDRPLDFTAVTDHSEFMGEMRMCTTAGSPGYWHPVCIAHRHLPQLTFATLAAYGMQGKNRWGFCGDNNEICFTQAADTWQDIRRAAEDAYDRSGDCSFTSFAAYEWTGTVGTGQNLHHNVVFKNDQVPDRALSWIESASQVTLWDYLDQECIEDKPGCDAVVIPHNSNLSGGLMFETARLANDQVPPEPVSAAEATRRARWHTLFEVMQHKGSSECDNRNPVWSEDEYCNFEKLGYDSFGGKNTGTPGGIDAKWLTLFMDEEDLPQTKLPDASNFLRYALKKGLQQQVELGVNSFKYGLVASTDTHIAAPGLTMEKNHPGHGGAGKGSRNELPKGLPDELEYGPGGLAVLYAEENTREALFAAMQRREAYATSGTRPILRFFGGWDYADDACSSNDMVARGYAGGVPMGGDLPAPATANAAPRFIVSALADSGTEQYPGNPLQRIQLIKGWYEQGELQEQVLDIAGGDNGASVDSSTCATRGSGHAQLCTVWQDNDFNPQAPAFYYTRVLENPSCRWSQQICVSAGVRCDDPSTLTEGLENCCRADHQKVIQERAWSSPIWYTPQS